MDLTYGDMQMLGLGEWWNYIGDTHPEHDSYVLVGYKLMDRNKGVVAPVWKSRKLCERVAKTRYAPH